VPRKLSKPSPPDLPLLKDRIRPGVRVLLVGINPGVRSALTGHHFAGYSNRFWKLLADSGLAPGPITYQDDDRLPEWGLGITNLVPRPTRGIDELTAHEYLAGRRALERKIRRYAPRIVALVGLTLARSLLRQTPRLVGTRGERAAPAVPPPSGIARAGAVGAASSLGGAVEDRSARKASKERRDPASTPSLGLQTVLLAGAPVFVLPNPSGRNAHFSYNDMLGAFRELKRYVDALPKSIAPPSPSTIETGDDDDDEDTH
jgi:TDG/mug DNA glycosylase family protein